MHIFNANNGNDMVMPGTWLILWITLLKRS